MDGIPDIAVLERPNDLRKAGRFEEAVPLYRQLWDGGSNDPWDGWGLAHCLRKLQRPAEALEVCEAVLAVDPGHGFTRSLMAWCLYDVHLQGSDVASSAVVSAVERIAEVLAPAPAERDGQFSALPIAVLKAAQLLEAAKDFDGALTVLRHTDPSRLSSQTKPAPDGKEWPTDQEQWHLLTTKALDKLQRWEESRQACTAALAAGLRFHNGQETWVRFRLGKACRHLGDLATAERELRDALARTPNPVIQGELASVLVAAGRDQEALPAFAAALLASRDLGPGVNWLQGVATCLERAGDVPLAAAHVRLSLALREERGWPVRRDLAELAEDLGVTGAPGDSRELEKELRRTWQQWTESATPSMTGTVKTILANGVAGFIRGSDGTERYFLLRDVRGPAVAQGVGVVFEPYERLDNRTGTMKPAARQVRRAA